jgi:glycosyltransferase involved in cell wall biosynthesis
LVEDHQLGLALTSDAPDDIAAALRRLVADPTLRLRMGENGARAFAGYTPEKLAEPIVDAICHGLRGSQPSLTDDNSPPIASASIGGKQVGR